MNDSTVSSAADAFGVIEQATSTPLESSLEVIDSESEDWMRPVVAESLALIGKEGQAVTVKIIGERMRQARELCSLSQSEAARQLGYANPSKLSKIEAASDTNSVPLWLIRKAAEVYEVGVGYLFGEGGADDWEIGLRMTQEREVSAWLKKQWVVARERDLSVLRMLNDRLFELRTGAAEIRAGIRASDEALRQFSELNPEFEDDMRGSNRLVNAMQRALAATERFEIRLRKLHADRPVEIS